MGILKIAPQILVTIALSIVLAGGLSLLTGVVDNIYWAMAVGAITGMPLSMLAVILFTKKRNGVVKENE